MEGYHILANERLTQSIMNALGRKSYPTYAIIDKYGNAELSKAGYPMKRQKLTEQVEKVLKQ